MNTNENDKRIKMVAFDRVSEIRKSESRLYNFLIEKKVKTTGGATFAIKGVTVDGRGRIYLWDGDANHCFIDLGYVEFVD